MIPTEQTSEKNQKAVKLAKDILILSRNTLLVNLCFSDAALSQFKLWPIDTSTLLTDGKHMCTVGFAEGNWTKTEHEKEKPNE